MYFYKIIKFFLSLILKIFYRIETKGLDNIPKHGRAVLCSNHLNILDPIVLAIAIPRTISFMAKKELFRNKFLVNVLRLLTAFPVDREGSDLSAIRTSLKILQNERVLGIFPEGTRKSKMDLESVKPGIGLISIKAKSPIIPVAIQSNYRLFSKIKIRIGQPIYLNDYYGQKLKTQDYIKISKDILKSIYSLKNS